MSRVRVNVRAYIMGEKKIRKETDREVCAAAVHARVYAERYISPAARDLYPVNWSDRIITCSLGRRLLLYVPV